MATLAERYFKVDKEQQKIRRKAERERRKKEQQEKEHEKERIRVQEALMIYDEALEKLTSCKESDLRIIGTNLYKIDEKDGLSLLCKKDFNEKLKDPKKNKYYLAIHTVLLDRAKKHYKAFGNIYNFDNPCKYLFPTISENAIKILYEFSSGNFKTLFMLSRLCTDILNGASSIKKPYVILADKKIHKNIFDLLMIISEQYFANIDFCELTKINNLSRLLAECHCGNRVAVSYNGKIPEKEFAVKRMQKIISGETISIKHPSFPEYLHFSYKIPFVYVTDNHAAYKKMKTLYNATDIKISSNNLNALKYDEYAIQFIKYNLYNLTNNPKISKMKYSTVSKKIAKDSVFGDFIEKYCIINENAVCEKALLYEAYSEYYKKNFGDEPLTKILFSKKFAAFGNFETVRPHSSREHYPYCFKGIELDKEKVKQLSNECAARYFTTYETFRDNMVKLFQDTQE